MSEKFNKIATRKEKVKGRRIEAWKLVNDSANELPRSPVSAAGDLEKLILIPYGCTNLRIAEFPILKEE